MAGIDIFIILTYLMAMMAVGWYFSKKNNSSLQFTSASGRIPGWAIGLSFYATFLSAITFLGDPGKSFGSNCNPFVFSLSMPFAAYISSKYFVKFYRESGEISAYTHLEKRFGSWARTYVMFSFILTQLARMGTIFYAVALAINTFTGISIPLIIVVLGLAVMIYTASGGMEAIIWTEVIQAVLKTLGALLILILILKSVSIEKVVELGIQEQKFSLGTFQPDFNQSSFWVVFIYGFFINLVNFGVDQNYIQRYHTAQSTADARKSIWLCVAYYVPVSFLFFFIGTALYAYYQYFTDQILEIKQWVAQEKGLNLAQLVPADYGDRVLPHFIKTRFSPGLFGLLLAAMLSAAMSTLSSSMNSSGTVFIKDFYQKYLNTQASAKQELRALKIATVVFGILGMTFGISMIGAKSLLDAWWKLSGIFAGGMLGIFLLSFLIKNATSKAAIVATIAGILVIGYMSFNAFLPPIFQTQLEPKLTVALGTISILGVGYVVTLFIKKEIKNKKP